MQKLLIWVASVALVCGAATQLQAQKYTPRSIQFKGMPEYTHEELLAAAQLKPGEALSVTEMDEHSKILLTTGMFSKIGYTFNGQDLIYELKPTAPIYPLKFTNLPPVPGLDLEAVLRARVPLYHGKVPLESGLSEQVRTTLEQIFAAKGFPVTLIAATDSGPRTKKEISVSISVIAPEIHVGPITIAANSEHPEAGALAILQHLEESPYDAEGSPSQISTYLGNDYHDKGYLEAKIEPHLGESAAVSKDAIRVPFSVSIAPGILYRLSSIHLDPSMVETQQDFDRQTDLHRGDIAEGHRLTKCWEFIARKYRNHGFMKASIHPEPAFDRDHATVSYTVTADSGPVYAMGKLTVENVSDDLRAMILAAWKLPAGATFDESALLRLFAIGDANPTLGRIFASVHCKYTLHLNDEDRTVDVVLRLEKR